MFPSWMSSRNCSPLSVYFFAMETTSLRFASTRSLLESWASRSPTAMRLKVRSSSCTSHPMSSSREIRSRQTSVRRRRRSRRALSSRVSLSRLLSPAISRSSSCILSAPVLQRHQPATQPLGLLQHPGDTGHRAGDGGKTPGGAGLLVVAKQDPVHRGAVVPSHQLAQAQDLDADIVIPGEGPQDFLLSALDPARDVDLSFLVEKRHGAHLAQVH